MYNIYPLFYRCSTAVPNLNTGEISFWHYYLWILPVHFVFLCSVSRRFRSTTGRYKVVWWELWVINTSISWAVRLSWLLLLLAGYCTNFN